MIEPGTHFCEPSACGVKPPGPTPWMATRWWTRRFSLYSPRGLSAVGAPGHTTTSQYLRPEVGAAASSAAWTVSYCLPRPTSATFGLDAVEALLPGAAPRFQMVMPLYVDRLEPLVIDTLRAPRAVVDVDVKAGT